MSRKFVALIVVLVVGIFYFVVRWQLTEQDLALAMAELSGTQATLAGSEGELLNTQSELAALRSELESTQSYLADVEAELQLTNDNLSNVEAELADTKDRLDAVEADALHLHNPTYEEALDFLERDRTDANEYIEGEYVCSHFAADINNNAEKQGIRCALVDVRFPDSGHAIIAFETTDEGLVYFEPLTDDRVRPVIGKRYYRCIEPEPGYIYSKPSFNDTIEDIVVIW
ncbi:MAG: hypothetical protein P8X92_01250 [Dehalococcoidia bacterium]